VLDVLFDVGRQGRLPPRKVKKGSSIQKPIQNNGSATKWLDGKRSRDIHTLSKKTPSTSTLAT
jgi:hypothetical protein